MSDADAAIMSNVTNASNTFGRGTPQLSQVLRVLLEYIDDELVLLNPSKPTRGDILLKTKAHVESELRLCTTQIDSIADKMTDLNMGDLS